MKLNVNMDMIMKNVKLVELHTKKATVFLNRRFSQKIFYKIQMSMLQQKIINKFDEKLKEQVFNESAKLRALRAHVPTCLACLRAHLPMCLACLRAHVLTCQRVLRAHVLTFPRALRAYMLKCQRALHALRTYVLTCYNYN